MFNSHNKHSIRINKLDCKDYIKYLGIVVKIHIVNAVSDCRQDMDSESIIPRLTLPMDFGLEKLHEPNNNNMFFSLQNGRKMGAAALMLAIHSPVLEENYIKPGLKEIDVKEFRARTVVTFVEAMYNGIFEVTIENFRDLHKLCSVFEVNWMVARCIQFFRDSIENADSSAILLLFEETMWACETRKSDVLFEIWREGLGAKEDPGLDCNTYIKRYIAENYEEISEYTLKKLISVTDDHAVFVEFISSRVQVENLNLDKTSRFLLLNIDLSMCMERRMDELTEIFDVLLQDAASPDFITILNLQRQTSKAYIEMLKTERATLSAVARPASPTAACNQSIPNLFREFTQVYNDTKDNTVEATLEHLADIGCNLYSVIGYMDDVCIQVDDSVLAKLRELKKEKGWNHVHPEFVAGLTSMTDDGKLMVSTSADITSNRHSIRVLSEEVMTIWDFLTKSAVYTFKIQVPGPSISENELECGFLVEKTGVSCVNASSGFDLKLIVDKEKYPEGLTYNGISADKIYLVSECPGNDRIDLAWLGIPVYQDDGSVMWPCENVEVSYTADDKENIRLAAYCSVE